MRPPKFEKKYCVYSLCSLEWNSSAEFSVLYKLFLSFFLFFSPPLPSSPLFSPPFPSPSLSFFVLGQLSSSFLTSAIPSLLAEDLNSSLREIETIRRELFCFPSSFSNLQTHPFYCILSPLFSLSQSRSAPFSLPSVDLLIQLAPCRLPPPTATAEPLSWAALSTPRIPKCYIHFWSFFSDRISHHRLNIFIRIPNGFLEFNMSKADIFISLWKISNFLSSPCFAE